MTQSGGNLPAGAGENRILTPQETEKLANQLAAIVESSEDAIIGKSPQGVIESWNGTAERIYGYSAAEAIGRSMLMLMPPDRLNEEAEILRRIQNGERVQHYDTVRVRKDGTRIAVSLTISPIRNRSGRIIGASHVARDITSRLEYERNAARLAAIVESSDDAIVSKTLEGIVLTWNTGAERIYGYSAQEIIGCPINLLVPPERANEELDILERMGRGERVDHFETVRVCKGGGHIQVSLTISPIRDASGTVIGASHIARDITARKGLEEQLWQSQKLESLGVLAGGVAHDFNNLLTGILGNASLLVESSPPESADRPILNEIAFAAERAAKLTRQLLAYAGKGRFTIETVSLSDLVRETARLVEASIPKTVTVAFDLADDLPLIEADVSQIQQVIMNLVINGAEAMGDSTGSMAITTGVQDVDEAYLATIAGQENLRTGRYVVLEVHDTGCGMDPATMSKIFDPFFTTKFTGRGLGLAAVLGIVRGHRGTLTVSSAPGQGTTFRVLLPATTATRLARVRERRGEIAGTGTVMVVDDEETVRQAARNVLERYGYRVLLARNGAEAVEVLRTFPDAISLVVLDLTMPVMSGEDAIQHLRAVRPSVRVLLSSGFNEVEAIRRFTGKGLSGFIQKPYTARVLLQKVKAILETNIEVAANVQESPLG